MLRPGQIILMLYSFCMITAINLNNEIIIGQQEIYNIISDNVLPEHFSTE